MKRSVSPRPSEDNGKAELVPGEDEANRRTAKFAGRVSGAAISNAHDVAR
jgi:hypothetical protein